MATAEEYATRVLGFNSQQRMARIVLGLRDFRSRHYADARKNFQAAAYTPVGELTSALLIAWAHAGEGELNLALKALDRLDINESFANFKSFHSGLISDYLGNAIRAEASYRKAYDEAGTSLRVVQAYGNFLERNGRACRSHQDLPRLHRWRRRQPADRRGAGQCRKGHQAGSLHRRRRAPVPPRRCSRSPPR